MEKQLELGFNVEDLIEWKKLKETIDEFPYDDIVKKNMFLMWKKYILSDISSGVSVEKHFYSLDGPKGFIYKFIDECIKEIKEEFGDKLLDLNSSMISIERQESTYDVSDYKYTFHIDLKPTQENCKNIINRYIERINKDGINDKRNIQTLLQKMDLDYIHKLIKKIEEDGSLRGSNI